MRAPRRRSILMQLCIAMAPLFVSTGCATRISAVRPVSPEMAAEINDTIAGKRAAVKFAGTDQRIDTKDVRLTGSSVRFVKRSPASTWLLSSWLPEREAPVTSVESIKIRRTGRGALHGLAIGAPIGFVSGGIAGAALS